MTYVEFPFDRIMELHVKKKDDGGGGPDPPEVECGQYYLDMGVGVPTGSPAWQPNYMRLLTAFGIIFDYPKYVTAGSGTPITDYMIPMTGVVAYAMQWSVTVTGIPDPNHPLGTPVNAVMGSGIGWGVSNAENTAGWGKINPVNGLPYYPAPGDANLGASGGADLTGPGGTASMSLGATYSVKQHGDAALWTGGMGEAVMVHNIHTEEAPEDGWAFIVYTGVPGGFLQITGICEAGAHAHDEQQVVRVSQAAAGPGETIKW